MIAPSNYGQILRGNAFKRLDAGVDVPSINLAIESGEDHTPVKIYYRVGPQQKQVAPYLKSIDDTGVNGQGNPVDPKDFSNTGYLGDAIGYMGGV